MITVNAMGEACPIPVIKTNNAIKNLVQEDQIEVLVDNDVAVQNLTRLANKMGFPVESRRMGANQYRVIMDAKPIADLSTGTQESEKKETVTSANAVFETIACTPKNVVVVISSGTMGEGDEALGASLLKGFLYAISQREELPKTILFYNGGAKITCEGSASIEDLKYMESQGVEIYTCGTCLNHYGITEKLCVGEVTNMYVIAEKMSEASLIIKP